LSQSAGQSSRECQEFKEKLKTIILKPTEVFNGMTYADLLREWLIWLHSDSPVYRGYRGEICYLRGNLSYSYDPNTGIRRQAEGFQNRARNMETKAFKGDTIFSDTPIFIPVTSAYYSVGESFSYGAQLQSLADCQLICRRDIREIGPMWFKIQKRGCKNEIYDLTDAACYVESPSFKMTVTRNSPLREYFEMPIEPGEHETFTAAYAILIRELPPGEYRVQYGAFGSRMYYTDTIHEFVVKDVEKEIRITKEVDDNMLESRLQRRTESGGFEIPDTHIKDVGDFNA
jgi:hypothetical protein